MRRGHAGKVDANQREIVAALRKAGCRVLSLAPLGKGCPDLLVDSAQGLMLLEVKTRTGKATADQERFYEAGWPVFLVRSAADALALVTAKLTIY